MRAERLLSILLILQSKTRMTALELAKRLNVSERTIHRDMEALSMAGIPVLAERGRNGGWSVVEGYRTTLTGLSPAEIQALILAPAQLLADLGLEDAAEAATLKLLASLPAFRRQDAEFVRQRIHVDGAAWHSMNEDLRCLSPLQEAVWQSRVTEIVYTRGDDETVTRTVEPLGLVAKGRIWYLVAAVENDIRTYRVSRVQKVHSSDRAFLRPENFDLAAFWEESSREFLANLPKYPAILRVHNEAIRHLQAWRWANIQKIEAKDSQGWQIVHVHFEEAEEASAAILACAGMAQVIEPDELKLKVREKLHTMLNAFICDSTNSI